MRNRTTAPPPIGRMTLAVSVGFLPLFAGLRFHFWAQMALTVLLAIGLCGRWWPQGLRRMAASLRNEPIKNLVLGLASAALLYGVFALGNTLSRWLFSFAGDQIGGVYAFKTGAPTGVMALLIALIIGPGEEILWRGLLQDAFETRWGWKGLIYSTALYAAVHLTSGNLMLVLAAAVCGAFWAVTYWKFRSITLNIISHVAWDLAVFLFFPFS